MPIWKIRSRTKIRRGQDPKVERFMDVFPKKSNVVMGQKEVENIIALLPGVAPILRISYKRDFRKLENSVIRIVSARIRSTEHVTMG